MSQAQQKMAAPNPSVGADGGQPLCKTYIQSIPQPSEKGKENPGPAPPLSMPFHFEQLPDSLKASGQFCLWRYELRGGRQTKVPYDPITKARARSNDPSSFSDYPTALRQHGFDGLGVGIFGALCAIDLDHCVTVTGNRANDFDIGDRSAELSQFLERYMRRDSAAGNAANAADASILRLVSTLPLWKGQYDRYPSHSEADLALLRELAVHTGCNAAQMDRLFRQSGLMREKWDRPQSGSTYGAISIEKAIALCRTPTVESFPPLIPLTQSAASLPAFPIWCLPAPFAAYAEAVAQHSQTAVDMAGVIALGVLAVCFQGKYLVQGTPGYRHGSLCNHPKRRETESKILPRVQICPLAEILLGRAFPKPSRADGSPLRKFIQRSMKPIPKTYQTPHRTRIVKTRLSEEEYEEFRHRCDVYQVSQSEWLRQLIQTGRVHTTIRATLTSDELLEAIGKLTAQYGKIGSNLNQIARFLQTQGMPYNTLSEEVRTAISELADLKYQVLTQVGDAVGNVQTYRL